MPASDLIDLIERADPARGDDDRDVAALRDAVLARATAATHDVPRAPSPRRTWRARALVAGAATVAVGSALALWPASQSTTDRRAPGVPGSAVAAFAQELAEPGVLRATTITRGSVDAQGRLDDGGASMRSDLWFAVDGSRFRETTTIGEHPPIHTVFDGREYRTYTAKEGLRSRMPKEAANGPGAPRFAGEPFVARTLRLADRLARGDYVRLGTETIEGRQVTVVGTDQEPQDEHPVDQRFYLDQDERRLVRIDTLELPFPAGTTASEYVWQRDDVTAFEVVPETEDVRRQLEVPAELRAAK